MEKKCWRIRFSGLCSLLAVGGCIVLMGQSSAVAAVEELALPSDFRVIEYFSFFGSRGIDWQALSDPNNNPILVACLKGVADESLKPPGILDVQKRLERLERGGLVKKADGRYSLAFPAVVGDKRNQLQKYAEQAALQLVPFGEKMIAQIRAHLAGRDEMVYHVLWSVIMDGGPAWDAARAEMKKKITAGDTSTENKAWLLYPSHPFQVGTNGYNSSYGHLAITWSRNTPSPNAIGSIISRNISQLSQAIEQNRAVEPADVKDALGKYGLVDEAGKVRIYTIQSNSNAAKSYAELGAQFGRQIMTYLDVKKIAEMLEVSPGIAFVIAYHEICWQLLQDLAEKKALSIPPIIGQASTKTSDAYQLVSLATIGSVPAAGSGSPPAKEAQTPGQSKGNRVLSLDGQDDCMRVADSQSLQSFTDAITLEVWLMASSLYTENGKINSVIRKNVMSGAENFLLRFRNMEGSPRAQMALGGLGALQAPFEFTANNWYHIAGTYDGRAITIFVNGLAAVTQNASGRLRIDQSDLYIGKGDPASISSGEYFHGALDEIRIWNVARSQEQIHGAMNTPLTGKEEGLVAYWNFDDGTAKDLSGHGNDGVLTGDARIVEAPPPAQERPSESEKAEVKQEPADISAYFEKMKNEILQGRRFSNQSTPVNALLTLISAYHHQDRNTLERIFPIVRQKQFERLASPETGSQMLAAVRKSILCRIEIGNEAPKESDLSAIYSSQSPEKTIDQVWSFAYVGGAWRFAGSTSEADNWRAQAQQAEAMTRTILQSEIQKTKSSATNAPQQKANQVEGKWEATLVEFNQTHEMRFWRKPDGTLAGAATRQIPDDRPFDGVTFENGKLRFEEKVNQGVFEGTMKEDGLTIEGKWQTPRMLTSCVLKRVGDVEIEDKGQSDSGITQSSEKQLQRHNNLVAWWKLENDPNDSAGANHGTVHGNPQYVDGKVGRAISFDGNDYVDCGKPDSLNFGTGDWTLSAWIKTTQSGTEPANRGTIFANGGDEAGGIRYALAVNEEYLGTLVLTTDNDTYKVQAFGKSAVNDGNWHHVVGTRNADQLRVYVDGALDGDASLPAGCDLSGVSQHNAYIGVITDHRDSSLFKYFVGLIDEVCIFGGAVDANGVRSLYAGEDPSKIAQTAILTRAEPQPRARQVTAPSEAAPASPERLQGQTSGTSRIATALILVLVLACVVAAVVLFLVRSSIRR